MPNALDRLDWKPWPKDPEEWVYADVPGVARVSQNKRTLGYSIRNFEETGDLGRWHCTNQSKAEIERVLFRMLNGRTLPAKNRKLEATLAQEGVD